MSVLSVDLACRSWSDLGVVLLERKGAFISCEIIRWHEPYPPPVVELALRLNTVCLEHNATVLMLDGLQAWRSEENPHPFQHSPEGERNSPETTDMRRAEGSLVGYCLALYEALGRLGWQRLAGTQSLEAGQFGAMPRILIESYPQAAWQSLGIPPLPARRECRVSHLAEAYSALTALLPVTTSQPPNHGQLQAIVGGLPGLAIEERSLSDAMIAGRPTRWEEGLWQDGLLAPPPPLSAEGNRAKAIPTKS